jgi:hypothetical protein
MLVVEPHTGVVVASTISLHEEHHENKVVIVLQLEHALLNATIVLDGLVVVDTYHQMQLGFIDLLFLQKGHHQK